MNIVIFLIAGSVIGWVASLIMWTAARPGILLNINVGVAGTALGGFLIGPMFGTSALNQSGSASLASAAVSIAGALLLLAVWNLIRRGRVR